MRAAQREDVEGRRIRADRVEGGKKNTFVAVKFNLDVSLRQAQI